MISGGCSLPSLRLYVYSIIDFKVIHKLLSVFFTLHCRIPLPCRILPPNFPPGFRCLFSPMPVSPYHASEQNSLHICFQRKPSQDDAQHMEKFLRYLIRFSGNNPHAKFDSPLVNLSAAHGSNGSSLQRQNRLKVRNTAGGNSLRLWFQHDALTVSGMLQCAKLSAAHGSTRRYPCAINLA